MKIRKKYFGSKAKANEAAYLLRKLNQWVCWANANRRYDEPTWREVTYGIN